MSLGTTLLRMQELDLSLSHEKKELASMPEIAALAKKRQAYQKLKADATKLYARRKDIDTYLKELSAQEDSARAIQANARKHVDFSDYRDVQRYEIELSDAAKKLDKIEFTRKDYLRQLDELSKKERYLAEYIKKFEASVVEDTRKARLKASDIQEHIAQQERERAHLAQTLSADELARYEQAAQRFDGLAVETLKGSIPSLCRMTLQSSSMDELKHAHGMTECPYCHRILVLEEQE